MFSSVAVAVSARISIPIGGEAGGDARAAAPGVEGVGVTERTDDEREGDGEEERHVLVRMHLYVRAVCVRR